LRLAWHGGALSPMSRSPETAVDDPFVPKSIRVCSADGAAAELGLIVPASAKHGVFWLPALGVSAHHYQKFAMELAEAGIASARHEWRGTGSSAIRASRSCDWGYRELLELDMPAGIAAAQAACPGVRWVIAGHSLGGQLACLFAALNPGTVDGVAFVASGIPYWRTFGGTSGYLLRMVPLLIPAAMALWGYYPGKRLGFAGNEARRLMRDWARTVRHGQYANHAHGLDYESALATFTSPLLGVRLTGDRLGPEASFDGLLDKMRKATIERVVLSAADFPSGTANHFSWMKEPAPVVAAMVRWLQAIETSKS